MEDVAAFGDKLHVRVKENTAQNVISRLPKAIEAQNAKLIEVRQIPPALEDVFIALSETDSKVSRFSNFPTPGDPSTGSGQRFGHQESK